MRAIDTNVLVCAEMQTSSHHAGAYRIRKELAAGPLPWAIPWPCVYEFLRVVTHPRVFHPPLSLGTALQDLDSILSSPSLVLLSETHRHAKILDSVLRQSRATGNLIYDAHIAALCLEHGVSELLTGDRDFLRFSGLRVTDPFHEP